MTEFEIQAEQFATMVPVSPDGENGKIDTARAIYCTITEIKKAVGVVLEEKI
jgi:hypothetical protein